MIFNRTQGVVRREANDLRQIGSVMEAVTLEQVAHAVNAILKGVERILEILEAKEKPKKKYAKRERAPKLEKAIFEILADGKIWASQAVVEALLEKGITAKLGSVRMRLSELAKSGKLVKVAKGVYRLRAG